MTGAIAYQKCMVYIFDMHGVNLSGLDLNLLPPLEALLRRRNVTHAAKDVGLSQPAMSRALARLRDILGDPLLVRGAKSLTLTPRGETLLPIVIAALADLKTVFRPPSFDPATAERVIRFAASDVQTVLIAPLLQTIMRREAPGLNLRFESYGRDVASRIEDGRLDFAFALTSSPLPPGAASFMLAEDRLALVMRRGHPLSRKDWTLKDYGEINHIGVTLTDDGLSEIDARLASQSVTRRIVLSTPYFVAALAAVGASDAVTTISRAYAQLFADQFALVLREPPFEHTAMTMVLVTSAVRAHDPLMLWIVEKTRQAAEVAYSETSS
jgi:DNA-binding transcriptional LysR family regulator